jgi:hypothetical protein
MVVPRWVNGMVGGGAFVGLKSMDGTAVLLKEDTGLAAAGKAVGSKSAVLVGLAGGKHTQGFDVALRIRVALPIV